MSAESLTRAQRTAVTKRRRMSAWILDAARSLFDGHGYHGVTRDDVCQTGGFGATTLSNHFPTKRALAIAAYAPDVQVLMQSAEEAVSKDTAPETVVRHFIRKFAGVLASHPAMAFALLPLSLDPRATSADDESVHVLSFWQLVEFLAKLLERCDHVNQRTAQAVDVADLFLSGLLTWIVQHPERSGEEAANLMLSQLF